MIFLLFVPNLVSKVGKIQKNSQPFQELGGIPMLRRDVRKSFLSGIGFRRQNFFHVGWGVLPLLAGMLLATPQLALANGPTVTVNPDSLVIVEDRARTRRTPTR